MQTKTIKVRRILKIILVANLFVALVKLVVGWQINSTSLTADGFHSLGDGASNVVGLVGLYFASRPEDEDHPYGHKKIESLAGMFIGGMLLTVGFKVLSGGIMGLVNPSPPTVTTASLAALILTLVINVVVSTTEFRQGKKLKSQILISDSLHTRSDIFVSLGILATLVGLKMGLPPVIDSIASIVVAGFIFHAAYEIFSETTKVLLDAAVVEKEVIKELVMEFEDIHDVHRIRSRGREDDMYIDLHVKVPASMPVEACHQLITRVSERIRSAIGEQTEVIIHIEPSK